jgi:hypothetical protein
MVFVVSFFMLASSLVFHRKIAVLEAMDSGDLDDADN